MASKRISKVGKRAIANNVKKKKSNDDDDVNEKLDAAAPFSFEGTPSFSLSQSTGPRSRSFSRPRGLSESECACSGACLWLGSFARERASDERREKEKKPSLPSEALSSRALTLLSLPSPTKSTKTGAARPPEGPADVVLCRTRGR